MKISKKPKESTSMLIRRFSQKVRESGILEEAKKSRFQDKKISRTERKKYAVERDKKRKEKRRLRKLGKL